MTWAMSGTRNLVFAVLGKIYFDGQDFDNTREAQSRRGRLTASTTGSPRHVANLKGIGRRAPIRLPHHA